MVILIEKYGIGEKVDKNDDKIINIGNPPPTQPGNGGGNGGNYNNLSERLTRLETEFKEVVKKSDLERQTRELENVFREEVQKAVDNERSKWMRWIGIILSVCIALMVFYNTFLGG